VEIRIFDVDHGACALVVGDHDPFSRFNIALLDCGAGAAAFQPSQHLRRSGLVCVDHLIISHFDEDHVTDLPNLLAYGPPILNVHANNTMSPIQIWDMKRSAGPVEPAVASAIGLLASRFPVDNYAAFAARPLLGFEVTQFRNHYPADFSEPNNLSLVTFLHHPSVSIVFPGDLETPGWQALLRSPAFRANLARVDVFVTSHHGRSNGYCREVFDCCQPEIFITSDTNRIYGTQEQRYDQHTEGIPWNGGPERRKCLTTRQDRHIRITNDVPGYRFFVRSEVAFG
jgi:beta-lactamase superfamily II metal-dependent hydrolase